MQNGRLSTLREERWRKKAKNIAEAKTKYREGESSGSCPGGGGGRRGPLRKWKIETKKKIGPKQCMKEHYLGSKEEKST